MELINYENKRAEKEKHPIVYSRWGWRTTWRKRGEIEMFKQRLLNVDFYRCSIKSNGSPPMDPRRNSGTLPNSINCKFVLPQDSSFKHELAEPTAVNLNFPAFKIAAQTEKIFQCYSVIILRKFLKNFHFNFFFSDFNFIFIVWKSISSFLQIYNWDFFKFFSTIFFIF